MPKTEAAHPAHVKVARLFASDKLIGPPMSEDLVELMELMFTADEAEVAAHVLPFRQLTTAQIARRARRPEATLRPLVEAMAERKVVYRGKKGFCLLPILPGTFELVLMDGQDSPFHREFARRVHALFATGYMKGHIGAPTQTVRTIPVDRAIGERTRQVDGELIQAIIDAHDEMAVLTTCQCRQATLLTERPCRKATAADGCLTFGSFARFFVDQGGARFVTKDEMRRVVEDRWSKQLVFFGGNVAPASPNLICTCCDCCCHMLEGIIRPDPSILITAPAFLAEVDESRCTHCGRCVAACNTEAHSLAKKTHRYELSKCVGCGLCVQACEDEAIRLRPNDAFRPPPKTFARLALRLTPAKVASLAHSKLTGRVSGGSVPLAGGPIPDLAAKLLETASGPAQRLRTTAERARRWLR